MKNIILIFIASSFLTIDAFSQTEPSDSLPSIEFQRQIFIYGAAKKYNDKFTQLTALYNILSYNPDNSAVLDSIALIYYDFQQYVSAALTSVDALILNPNDELATEIAAISFEQLGAIDRSLPYYESLYLINNNPALLYQISFMQYQLKRYNEALTNVDIVLADSKVNESKILFPVNENQEQQVSLGAAVLRLKGMVLENQGDLVGAKEAFNQALIIAPDFALLKEQLKNIN